MKKIIVICTNCKGHVKLSPEQIEEFFDTFPNGYILKTNLPLSKTLQCPHCHLPLNDMKDTSFEEVTN